MTTKRRELTFHGTAVTLAALALLAGCANTPRIDTPKNTGWVSDEVSDSYVFGFPLVLMDVERAAETGSAPGQAAPNTLRHAQSLPPVGAANPPEPNLDTLASSAWLDLADGPVLVSLPDSHGRYADARALDMWTNVVWSTGADAAQRASGLKAQTIAFVPAGWTGTLPARVKRIDVSTRYVSFRARIETRGGADLNAVRKLQRAFRVAPLAEWGDAGKRAANASAAPAAQPIADPPAPQAPAAQMAALDAKGFFGRLSDALADNPAASDDSHALQILADIGVRPGEAVEFPRNANEAVTAGFADGRARVATPPSNVLAGNGWRWVGEDAGRYGPDYALRAYAAYAYRGLATSADEVRARVSVDADGHPLNGANRYVIHFSPKQLPPVRGFWSITAYTTDGALDGEQPVRTAFGDHNGARRNRDGSLDVQIAARRPRGAANWVAVPRGDFELVLRLYAPKPAAVDGSWAPPPVELR